MHDGNTPDSAAEVISEWVLMGGNMWVKQVASKFDYAIRTLSFSRLGRHNERFH